MMRFIFLVVLVVALWYGWQHYGDIFNRPQGHEAVVENRSGREMIRVRLSVGGKTFVRESVPDESNAEFPFQVSSDASFTLVWQFANRIGEHTWSGGMVPRGPMLQRHFFSVDGDGQVLYRAENK